MTLAPTCPVYISKDHTENAALLLLRACMLRALSNNGRYLESHSIATGLNATISNIPQIMDYNEPNISNL